MAVNGSVYHRRHHHSKAKAEGGSGKGKRNSSYWQDSPLVGPADCCMLLQGLNFSSNLPVVIIDTRSKWVVEKHANVKSLMCTCGAPGG